MDRLDAMALFVSVVEEGSLAAAARRHGRSPATVTRAIALLEEYARETLLLRSTRRLSLTEAGERHLAIWREVLAKLREGEGETAQVQGGLVVTAPELFGRLKVLPILEEFLLDFPRASARVLMTNRLVNLIGEGVDIAVRLAPLPDSALTATRVGEVRRLVCASPDYLARAGTPTTLGDLAQHECIGLNAEGEGELWPFKIASPEGARLRSVRVRARLSVNNAAAAIEAALRGRGVVSVRSYQVAAAIGAGRLVRLLADFEPPPTPVSVVFPPDRARRKVVRALVDALVPRLRRDLEEAELMASRLPPQS